MTQSSVEKISFFFGTSQHWHNGIVCQGIEYWRRMIWLHNFYFPSSDFRKIKGDVFEENENLYFLYHKNVETVKRLKAVYSRIRTAKRWQRTTKLYEEPYISSFITDQWLRWLERVKNYPKNDQAGAIEVLSVKRRNGNQQNGWIDKVQKDITALGSWGAYYNFS